MIFFRTITPEPKSRTSFLILLVSVLVATACIKKEITVEQIDAALGETIYIELPSNQSTGYSWSWINKEEVTLLDSIGVIYEVTKTRSASELGIEIWRFETTGVGEDIIVLEYKGRKKDESLKVHHYQVNIQE